jgi:hypothetical protein
LLPHSCFDSSFSCLFFVALEKKDFPRSLEKKGKKSQAERKTSKMSAVATSGLSALPNSAVVLALPTSAPGGGVVSAGDNLVQFIPAEGPAARLQLAKEKRARKTGGLKKDGTKREPSAYQKFVSANIARVQKENPGKRGMNIVADMWQKQKQATIASAVSPAPATA